MINMKISNEEYIREIKRFFNRRLGYSYDEGLHTLVIKYRKHYIFNNRFRYLEFDKSNMKACVERTYGTTFHSLYGKISVKFPSSYEKLCIINDLKGN